MNNDQVEQFALVYHSATTPSQSQQLLTDAPMSDTLWHHPAHQSPSVASPSSPFQSQFNRSADHSGYPSSPPFTQHGSPGSAADFSSPSDVSPLGSDSHFPQIESTVGPSRSPPRRHRAHLAGLHLSTRPDNPASPDETGGNAERSPTFFMAGSSSRPVSPTSPTQTRRALSHPHQERLALSMTPSPLSIPLQPPLSMQSPRYPSSPTSPYDTPYGFNYASHPRSNSASHSDDAPRSASPAISVASDRSSGSSSGSPPAASQSFSSLPQAPSGSLSERQKQRKQRLFNVDRKAICIYHLQYPNARQEDIAQRYGVERSTISKILKHKTKWMNVPEAENLRVAKHRPSKFPEIERELVKWLVDASLQSVQLTDASIRQQARIAAQRLNISEDKFKASSGWIENFKHRHGIRKGKWVGDGKEYAIGRANGLPPEALLHPSNPLLRPRPPPGHAMPTRVYLPTRPPGESDGMRQTIANLSSTSPMSMHPWQQPRSAEPSSNVPPLSQHHSHDQSSSVMRDPPSLQTLHHEQQEHHAHPTSPTQLQMDHHHHLSHQNTSPHQHHQPHNPPNHHPHSPPNHHQHSPPNHSPTAEHQQTSPVYHNGYEHSVIPAEPPLDVYAPVPAISDCSMPTLPVVEEAINKVILYVDSQPPGFLTDEERELLMRIKHILFQHGSGVPYDRV